MRIRLVAPSRPPSVPTPYGDASHASRRGLSGSRCTSRDSDCNSAVTARNDVVCSFSHCHSVYIRTKYVQWSNNYGQDAQETAIVVKLAEPRATFYQVRWIGRISNCLTFLSIGCRPSRTTWPMYTADWLKNSHCLWFSVSPA